MARSRASRSRRISLSGPTIPKPRSLVERADDGTVQGDWPPRRDAIANLAKLWSPIAAATINPVRSARPSLVAALTIASSRRRGGTSREEAGCCAGLNRFEARQPALRARNLQ